MLAAVNRDISIEWALKQMSDKTENVARSPGRPPKPVEESRSRRTVTFLTESEYGQLVEIARRNKLSISAVAHKLLVQSINSWN
jgi:hypothetical protein